MNTRPVLLSYTSDGGGGQAQLPYDTMHFDTGKFGAVVIVVALSLTVVLGYCTDVSKVEVERTDYDFITDITGLFETEQVPEYIDYNPNSNYVGYEGNVVYTSSNQPNNYRYVVEPGTTTTDSDTLGYNEIRPSPSGMSPFTVIYLNYVGSDYSLSYQFDSNRYNVYTFVNTSNAMNNASITTLYDVIVNSDLDYQNGQTLEIDFSTNINYPVFALSSFNDFTVQSGTIETWTATVNDTNVLERVVIDVTTLYARAYVGGVEVWSGSASEIPIIYSYQANGYTGSQTSDNVPLTLTMSASITSFPTYGYADPKGGVSLSDGYSSAIWDNGYEVEEVTVLLNQRNWPQQSAVNIQFYPYGSFAQNVRVSFFGGGTSVTVYDHVYGESTTIFGTWQGMEIVYNRITGIITATPTGTIRDFTEGPSVRGETIQLTTGWNPGESIPATSEITFRTGSGVLSPQFGIYSTSVFLNSYGVVMNDPSIDINEYWPNLDQYRLNFYSFALVGESVTINGVTYPVSGSQTITVTDAEGDEYTRTLTNIYITTEQGHTFLTFVNDGLTLDLGETVSEVVSFDGLWYFTTALYEVVQTTGHEYEWNIDGQFHATPQQTLVVFLGLLAIGVLVGKVALKQDISYLDWLLIIGAGVVAFAMSGVFF